ncbi:MAG: glycosyltransferase family 4 protein [Candidatus Sericytochromatia bacterium]
MSVEALRVRAPLYGSSGYACAAREFTLALADLQRFPIAIEPLNWLSGFDIQETRERYLRLRALETTPPTTSPANSHLLHWSIAPEYTGRGEYKRAIGHTIFETNTLLKSFVQGCNRMDAIMVPSAFHAQAFHEAGVKVPIQVIPEGVDCTRFTPDGPTLSNLPSRFTFLFVSQLSYRKGFDLVLKSFLELFAHHDDVQLVLRCYITDGSAKDLNQVEEFIRIFRQQEMGGLKRGHILLLDNVPDLHLPALYRSAQVLLAPFRGEGWGLPIIEALASETPVITTGWGGPLSYLQAETATLLKYTLQPIPAHIPELFLGQHLRQARSEGHLLAEPDGQQLKYAMWDAYQNYFIHKAKAVQARENLQAHWSWTDAARKFADWVEQTT